MQFLIYHITKILIVYGILSVWDGIRFGRSLLREIHKVNM